MRSSETETQRPITEIKEQKKDRTSFWDFFIVRDILSKIRAPREQHLTWKSGLYLNELRSVPKENLPHFLPELKRRVKKDAFSFLKEYGAFQNVIEYDDYSPFGIGEGYSSTDTVQRCINFVGYQELLGRPIERALLDVDLQKEIREWMTDDTIEPGSLCIFFSPRGTENESYPGLDLKYYNCIYVVCKKPDGGHSFKQIHSWDTNAQLSQLQNTLSAKGELHEVPIKHKAPPIEHQLLARYVTLSPDGVTPSQLMALIYQHKSTWKENPDEISPKIEKDLIESTLLTLSEAIATEFEKVVAASLILTEDTDMLSQHLDDLLEVFRDAVKRWSHDSASNFNETNKRLTDLASPERIQALIEAWKAKYRLRKGIASQEDRQTFVDFKSLVEIPLSSPIHRAASLAHCIVGSPLSMTNQLMQLQSPDFMSVLKTGNVTRSQLEKLIGKERAALWHHGKCITCPFEGLVGECDMCYMCEIDPNRRILPSDSLATTENKFLDSLPSKDKNKGKTLFSKFSKLVLRKTVSFEQLLFNDFVDPTATADDELEPYLDRILFAPNGLEELERIVSELSANNKEKEHKNSGRAFVMPKGASKSNEAVAA